MNHRTFCDIIDSYYNSIEKVIIFVERWCWWCVMTFRCDSSQKYLKIERWKNLRVEIWCKSLIRIKIFWIFLGGEQKSKLANWISCHTDTFESDFIPLVLPVMSYLCCLFFSFRFQPRSFYEFQTAAAVGVKQPAFECSFAYKQARLIFKT